MNEISINLLDIYPEVLKRFTTVDENIADDYCADTLYCSLLNNPNLLTDEEPVLNIGDESIHMLFVLLSVTPNYEEKEITKTHYNFFDKQTLLKITDTDKLTINALYSMVSFINIACYIIKNVLQEEQHDDKLQTVTKILQLAAAIMYDNLYSSKGKIKFSYYFTILLHMEVHGDFELAIEAYNHATHKRQYNRMKQAIKKHIDSTCKEKPYLLSIGNVVLALDKAEDHLYDKQLKYYIDIGTKTSTSKYKRIAISIFD